jgi:glycosyltransferase involved in cell wall biosynthesis
MHPVTVIVPNYNHAAFLGERLRSIQQQTFQDFELIFLDDASSDNSLKIAEAFAQKFPMRIVVNAVNSGTPFAQWNKGVELASGELVWIAESDDVSDPRFLEKMVSTLREHPDAVLAYASSRRMDASGAIGLRVEDRYRSLHPEQWDRDFKGDGPETCRRYLCHSNIIANASAVVFRRGVYQALGGADATFRYCGDWELWTRFLANASYAYVAEPLNFHRRHMDPIRSSPQLERDMQEIIRIWEGLRRFPGLDAEQRESSARIITAKTVSKVRQRRLDYSAALRLLRRLRGGWVPGLGNFAMESLRQFRKTGWR